MKKTAIAFIGLTSLALASFQRVQAEEETTTKPKISLRETGYLRVPMNFPQEAIYDTGIHIPYPKDGVKGIYVQAFRTTPEYLQPILDMVDTTPINSIVVDVRDGYGHMTMPLEVNSSLFKKYAEYEQPNPADFIKTLEAHQIYPIARLVCFADDFLPYDRKDLTFRTLDGEVWVDTDGGTYLNPYLKENWEYLKEIAISTAKLGFKDIQLDFVRFPLGFQYFEEDLDVDKGDYASITDNNEARRQAITDFVKYMKDSLAPYGVKVSADIIAFTTATGTESGIGQNFDDIAQVVDVMSSMIFPSHWGAGSLGIDSPDAQPYDIVKAYMEIERQKLIDLNVSPVSRPWLQAFTADYLGPGNFTLYYAEQIDAQIEALHDAGFKEYLLWSPNTAYSNDLTFDE